MKKIILFSLLFCAAVFVKAQGNLQFNQIILYDLASVGVQNITVPAGKVWKIESTGCGNSSAAPAIYLRNAASQNIAFFTNVGSQYYGSPYPYWLPSGFTGSFQNIASYRGTISIIEFNIVP